MNRFLPTNNLTVDAVLKKEGLDMASLRFLGLLFLLLAVAGCGESIKSVPISPGAPPAAVDSAKAVLNDLANTGEMGSGMETLKQSLEQIKQGDAAKGDALLADFEALSAETDAEKIKAKAKEMADKL